MAKRRHSAKQIISKLREACSYRSQGEVLQTEERGCRVQRTSWGERQMPAIRNTVIICLCAIALARAGTWLEAVGAELSPPRQLQLDDRLPAARDSAGQLIADTDGDGVEDARDVCCQTPRGVPVDASGRPLGDIDLDCDVDHADFATLQRAYTGPLEPCDTEICDNGVDDDYDFYIDCDDFDCVDDPARQ